MIDSTAAKAVSPPTTIKVPESISRSGVLARFFVVSYIAVLINATGYLQFVHFSGSLTTLFVAAVILTYSLIYVAPIFLLIGLLNLVLKTLSDRKWLSPRLAGAAVFTAAIGLTSLLQVLIFGDRFIFNLYGFHLNGFVWNLLTTRGGIASLGGSNSTTITFIFIVLIFIAVQIGLLFTVRGVPGVSRIIAKLLTRRKLIISICSCVALGAFERVTYGISSIEGYRPVLTASSAFPLYMPTTMTKFARSMGMTVVRQKSLNIPVDSMRMSYPRKPIEVVPVARPLNIVWLTSESMRQDMIDPEIMPNAWNLAHKAVWCRNHYSGGNGTRMGMFSMFYGLYGCFWFPIFDEQRSPVLMDVIQKSGYQLDLFTSASFTYPEFDRTMFVNVPADKLHEAGTILPWRRDIANTQDIIQFIESRDPAKPFMTFMFFESSHARYTFPESAVVKKPYAEDINYATMDVKKDINLIKARYMNACNHIDTQIGLILKCLDEQHLMDSTIVIVTGDHGEEFMEKGRWGHNSEFTEEQTRPPMVIWVPGVGHREITTMTSHLDMPATLMPLLGVKNPPRDYSLGYNILGDTRREYTVICDWNRIGYVDSEYKVVLPFKMAGFANQRVTTRNDSPVPENEEGSACGADRLGRIMTDLRAFSQ